MNKASLVVCVALLAGLTLGLAGQTQSGLAELHVQKIVLDPPSTVTRGEDVQIYARISNTGSRNANSFTVGFFYRPAREGEPWILLGTSEEEHLGPSQQDFLERTYDFETADMELGHYEIKVVADVSNQIPEVDELNNELTTSMELVASTIGLPELQPIQLAFEQTGTSEMDPWRITLVVENTGEYMLSSFAVLFLLDGQPMSIPMDPVTPFIPDTLGATTITGTLDPHSLELDPGTYLVTAVVDSAEQITEQDEGNNNISASLTIQTLELHPLSLRFDRSVVRLDEEVRVTSEIENTGSGLAKNVKVDFYIDHLRFASTQIDQLGAEPEEAAVTLDAQKLGLSTAPKVYDISVVVDPDNHLSESDEANNALMRTLTILEPEPKKPELHPESLKLTPASPAEIGKADIVTVTSVIKNTGRADAEAFDVGFYYRVKGGLRWDRFPCTDGVSCGEVTLSAGAQATLV
ncbi:MAG: CARDB domain-containing protein, partial [Candidatus Bipolaricaulia bacterium]